MHTIIGLAGTNGSGKDSVGQLLAEKYGYMFISVTDLLRAEAIKRGLPVEREYLREISAEWRRESGLGVLVDKAIEEYEMQKDQYTGVVMASMRNPGEADRIHEVNGMMVWTDADPKIRYDRIFSRQRTAEDNKTFEQFLAEEEAEMYSNGDATALRGAVVREKSDIFIENNGTYEEFEASVKSALGL